MITGGMVTSPDGEGKDDASTRRLEPGDVPGSKVGPGVTGDSVSSNVVGFAVPDVSCVSSVGSGVMFVMAGMGVGRGSALGCGVVP